MLCYGSGKLNETTIPYSLCCVVYKNRIENMLNLVENRKIRNYQRKR